MTRQSGRTSNSFFNTLEWLLFFFIWFKWRILFNRFLYNDFIISAKLVMDLLMKLNLPRNDCIDFSLWGNEIWEIVFSLLGSIFIPFLDTKKPNRIPLVTTNIVFFGFREILYFVQWSKNCLRWNILSFLCL